MLDRAALKETLLMNISHKRVPDSGSKVLSRTRGCGLGAASMIVFNTGQTQVHCEFKPGFSSHITFGQSKVMRLLANTMNIPSLVAFFKF